MPPDLQAAIELMDMLNKEGASLSFCDKTFDWHIRNLDGKKKITQEQLVKRLRNRHNMEDLVPCEVKTELPENGMVLKVPCVDAGACLRDLLSDPRMRDEDYLFFDDDPLAPPPLTLIGPF